MREYTSGWGWSWEWGRGALQRPHARGWVAAAAIMMPASEAPFLLASGVKSK